MMRSLSFTLLILALPACAPVGETAGEELEVGFDDDGKADSWATAINEDNLNGLWIATIGGQQLTQPVAIDSWPAVGVVIHMPNGDFRATRSVTTLTGAEVSLTLKPNAYGVSDDAIDGTIGGQTVSFKRDTRTKSRITTTLPADRPYRMWLNDVLLPEAQRDRESYIYMRADNMLRFFNSCELYKKGTWPRQYMKGATLSEQFANFRSVIYAMEGQRASPHSLIHNGKFVNTLNGVLKDPTKAALALTTFTMYFSTAAGRSLQIPITSDSKAYFITDRASRGLKIGLVVMQTPTHAALASTFGRQLLDMGLMTESDDLIYARAMMELLTRSDPRLASGLSPAGRSAITDWFAVMAIEDYRGVAFGYPSLGWGYNMTNVQFYGLVARALGRSAERDSEGKPVAAQVIVEGQLRPGDPSYADVLNHGNDMQEYPDMARLKELATSYLRQAHPELITAVEQAFAGVVPAQELDWRAEEDIFHFVTAQLYDDAGRQSVLTGARADAVVSAVTALLETLKKESVAFEQHILAAGLTKSNVAAPKSTGF